MSCYVFIYWCLNIRFCFVFCFHFCFLNNLFGLVLSFFYLVKNLTCDCYCRIHLYYLFQLLVIILWLFNAWFTAATYSRVLCSYLVVFFACFFFLNNCFPFLHFSVHIFSHMYSNSVWSV